MAKKSKNTLHGIKTKAGQILSQYIRAIAEEKTEVLLGEEDRMITKAEALARILWKHALGFEETDPDDPIKTIKHRPSLAHASLVYDRMEGRAPLMTDKKIDRASAADKVTEQGKIRINKVGGLPSD